MSSPADLAGRHQSGIGGESWPARPRRPRSWLLVAATTVAVLVVGAGVLQVARRILPGDPPLAAGAWSAHRTAADQAVTDATGTVWQPDDGLRGGGTQILPDPQPGTAARSCTRRPGSGPAAGRCRSPGRAGTPSTCWSRTCHPGRTPSST